MLGFDNHYIGSGTEDEKLTSEHRRFNELALKILTKRQEQYEMNTNATLCFVTFFIFTPSIIIAINASDMLDAMNTSANHYRNMLALNNRLTVVCYGVVAKNARYTPFDDENAA